MLDAKHYKQTVAVLAAAVKRSERVLGTVHVVRILNEEPLSHAWRDGYYMVMDEDDVDALIESGEIAAQQVCWSLKAEIGYAKFQRTEQGEMTMERILRCIKIWAEFIAKINEEYKDNEAVLYDRLTPAYQSILEKVSPNQLGILTAITYKLKPIGPTEIANHTFQSQNSVTSQVGTLVKKGILIKEDHKYFFADKRLFKWMVFRQHNLSEDYILRPHGVTEYIEDTLAEIERGDHGNE